MISRVQAEIILRTSKCSPLNELILFIRISACSLIIGMKSLSILKWKAGVSIFLLDLHFSPVLVTIPNPSQGCRNSYSDDLSMRDVLVSMDYK